MKMIKGRRRLRMFRRCTYYKTGEKKDAHVIRIIRSCMKDTCKCQPFRICSNDFTLYMSSNKMLNNYNHHKTLFVFLCLLPKVIITNFYIWNIFFDTRACHLTFAWSVNYTCSRVQLVLSSKIVGTRNYDVYTGWYLYQLEILTDMFF